MEYKKEYIPKVIDFIERNPDKINLKDISIFLNVKQNELKGFLSWAGINLREIRKKKVLELRELGLSNKNIAKIMGYSNPVHISRIAIKNGAKKYKRHRKYIQKSKLKEWIEKCKFNLSCVEKKYGLHKKRIKELVKRYMLDEWLYNGGFKHKDVSGEKKKLIISFLKANRKLKPKDIYSKILKIYGENYTTIDYVRKIRSKFLKGEIE